MISANYIIVIIGLLLRGFCYGGIFNMFVMEEVIFAFFPFCYMDFCFNDEKKKKKKKKKKTNNKTHTHTHGSI